LCFAFIYLAEAKETCSNDNLLMKTIGIIGTGRLGSHMACTWAAAGHTVILGSRDAQKAQRIVDKILSPEGYKGSGGENTPPFANADKAKLTGSDFETAAKLSEIIVLATPFPSTADVLRALKPHLGGKVIIDSTNPFYSGNGLPPGQPWDSAIEYHRSIADEPSASWATGYKTVYWTTIVPGGSGSFDTCGDDAARRAVAELAASHGFAATDRGSAAAASGLEPGRRR
jgi:hypothetical protein